MPKCETEEVKIVRAKKIYAKCPTCKKKVEYILLHKAIGFNRYHCSCSDCVNPKPINVPRYIPKEQIERYLNAKVR